MPIRINLLAEHFEQEELKRKDPVKWAVMGAVAVVSLFIAYACLVFLQASAKERALSAKMGEFKSIEGKYKQAMANNQLRSEIQAKLDIIDQVTAERFLWAPSLNALQFSMIDLIQITKISTEMKSQVIESIKDTVDTRGNKKPGKKGSATEEVTLNIEGKDFERPGVDNHLKFQNNLAKFSFFKTNLVPDGIRLTKQDPPTIDPETQRSFAIFGFACSYPKRTWTAK